MVINEPSFELLVVILVAVASGLAGWAFQNFLGRITQLERKLNALTRAMFYLVASNEEVPVESKRALESAMKEGSDGK